MAGGAVTRSGGLGVKSNGAVVDNSGVTCCCCNGGTCTNFSSGGKPVRFTYTASGIAVASGCTALSPTYPGPGVTYAAAQVSIDTGTYNGTQTLAIVGGFSACHYVKVSTPFADLVFDYYNAACASLTGGTAERRISFLVSASIVELFVYSLVGGSAPAAYVFYGQAPRDANNYASYTFSTNQLPGVGSKFSTPGTGSLPSGGDGPVMGSGGIVTVTPC